MDNSKILEDILSIVDNHVLNITENDVLEFLKNKKRWPIKYPWGQPSVEIIHQFCNGLGKQEFFDPNGYLIYDEWVKYYNLGFTTIISNVLDLNESLRFLEEEILKYTGTKVNGNFYFSVGSSKNRVSFDDHTHDYHVIIKPVYGKSKWRLSENKFETDKKSFLIKSGEVHSVYECKDKKLSLTLNIF
jgi:hypothetical protein